MKIRKHWRWMSALAAWLMLTGVATAQEGGGGGLERIVKDLGSAEFAVRERAQGELGKVGREQLGALKEAEKGATDAEVKARLHVRIAELAREPLLHPPKMSVDLKNATVAEVANTLNEEMGLPFIQVAPGEGVRRVTLRAQDQFLWEILRQVYAQAPMAIGSGKLVTPPARPVNTITLTPPTESTRAWPLYVVEGIGTTASIRPKEFTEGNLVVDCTIHTDPRVQVMRYATELRVEKAVDQDGRAIAEIPVEKPAASLPQRLASKIECTAKFVQDPRLKVIKELRGKAVVEVLESEEVAVIDLTKERNEPLETPWGRFTLEPAALGTLTLKLEPAATKGAAGGGSATATAASNPEPVIRLVYDNGGSTPLLRPTGTLSWRVNRRVGGSMGTRTAVMLEIVLSQKTRETTLPVVIKDLDVLANTQTVVRGR